MLLLTTGLAVACLAAAVEAGGAAVVPWITMYSQVDWQGDNLTLSGNVSLSDLRWHNVWSWCYVGSWAFYSGPFFTYRSDWKFQPSTDTVECLSAPDITQIPRSLRQLGDPSDIYADTLTLFQCVSFANERTYLSQDTPRMPTGGLFQSAVITGYQNWTLFSEQDYAGTAICLEAGQAYLPWASHFWNMTAYVRSARMGCFETTVRLEGNTDVGDASQSTCHAGGNYCDNNFQQ